MLARIIAILFPMFAIVAAGALYGRRHRPEMAHANQLNLDVFIPALVFAALASKSFALTQWWGLALGACVMILVSGLAAVPLARLLGVAPLTLAPPLMFNNSGNLGLPLAVLAFGEQALTPAVVMFVVSNLLHFSLGVWLLDHRARLTKLWRNPVVLASFAGLAVSMTGLTVWPPLMTAIELLGDISVPLALFALGVRLTASELGVWRLGLAAGIARPVIGMAVCIALGWALQLQGQAFALLVVFGALPPAVLNYVFAERYGQAPAQVASMVMIGNLLSLLFLPLALALVLE